MNLNAVKTELKKAQYNSLTDQQALDALPVVQGQLGRIQGDNKLDLITLVLGSGMMRRWSTLIAEEEAKQTPDIDRLSLLDALKSGLNPELLASDLMRINLAVPEVSEMLNGALAYEFLTQSEYNTIEYLGTYLTNADFDGVTLADIALARRLNETTTESIQSADVQNGKNLMLTLNENLPERVSVTVWQTQTGFEDINIGRPIFIENATKYLIKLSDIRINAGFNIEVRVACGGVDYSVGY